MKNTIYLLIVIHFLVSPVFSQNKKTLEVLSNKMCQYAKNEIQSQGAYLTKINTCVTNLLIHDIPVHYPKFSSKGEDFQMNFLSDVSIKCQELCPTIMLNLILSSDTTDFSKITDLEGKCVSGDCANGFGKYVWSNGSYHEGQWINNKKNGQGVFYYENGDFRKGNFKDDLLNGYGEENRSDGYRYVGEWKDGYYYGEGLLTWPNGETYMGGWDENGKSGYGVYTYKSGAVHKGQYLNDQPHGPGEWTYSDGKMIGEWVNGKKEGEFKIIFLSSDEEIIWVFENDIKIK